MRLLWIVSVCTVLGTAGTSRAQTYYLSTNRWDECAVIRADGDMCTLDTLVTSSDGCFYDLTQTANGALYGWWYSTVDTMGLYQIDTIDGTRTLTCVHEYPPSNLVDIDDSTLFTMAYGGFNLYKMHLNDCSLEQVPGGSVTHPPVGDLVLLGQDLYFLSGFDEVYKIHLNASLSAILDITILGQVQFPTGGGAKGLCASWAPEGPEVDRFLGFVAESVYYIHPNTLQTDLICTPLPIFGDYYGASVTSPVVSSAIGNAGTIPSRILVSSTQGAIDISADRGSIAAKVISLDGRIVAQRNTSQTMLRITMEGSSSGMYLVLVQTGYREHFVAKVWVD